MSERNWNELLAAQQAKGKFVCVGLDSDVDSPKFPTHLADKRFSNNQFAFNQSIVDATKDIAGCYKPNLAFYRGDAGKRSLQRIIQYINRVAPTVPVILDAKWGDIGNTNDGYVMDLGEFYGADAVTVHNYMGMEAMKPFLDQGDKGIIVLCRTSNPGSDEMQSILVQAWTQEEGEVLYPQREEVPGGPVHSVLVPNYQYVANRVANQWNINGNCALVVGATYADVELAIVREIVGDMPILLPGIGAQGGDLEATIDNGRNSQGQGMIVNSSRGIIFASSDHDFAQRAGEEAAKLHGAITARLAA
jgi:orotidine-5'-phosphate decarboxylase